MSQFENIRRGNFISTGLFLPPLLLWAGGGLTRRGIFSDVVNLMQTFSGVSNLACLFAVVLTRCPTEVFGKSICSMFHSL